jgi:hypothetical protein
VGDVRAKVLQGQDIRGCPLRRGNGGGGRSELFVCLVFFFRRVSAARWMPRAKTCRQAPQDGQQHISRLEPTRRGGSEMFRGGSAWALMRGRASARACTPRVGNSKKTHRHINITQGNALMEREHSARSPDHLQVARLQSFADLHPRARANVSFAKTSLGAGAILNRGDGQRGGEGADLLAVVVEDRHGLVVCPGVEDAVVVVLLELVDYGKQPVDQNRPEAGRKK